MTFEGQISLRVGFSNLHGRERQRAEQSENILEVINTARTEFGFGLSLLLAWYSRSLSEVEVSPTLRNVTSRPLFTIRGQNSA